MTDEPPLETVDPKRRSIAYQKPSLWRRVLWGVVAGPAWLVNKMLGGVR